VLKLFNPGAPLSTVAYEAEIAAKVHATGQACPAVGEIVTVDGRHGLVYERLDGELLMVHLRKSPGRLVPSMQTMAQLHVEMHRNVAATLPSLRVRLRRRIERAAPLTDRLRRAVLEVLDALPDGDRLCHGDFHPENILLTARGPVVIDWNDATQGHPLGDVARTLLLGRFAARAKKLPKRGLDGLVRTLILGVYRRHYSRSAPYDARLLNQWLIPVAAARLAENITEETPYLLRYLASAVNQSQMQAETRSVQR
jgi:Ser/Thr protein kinase RdoA (MazF antagonist)